MVVTLILITDLSCLGDIGRFSVAFGGNTGSGSTSLKLCVCNAVSSLSSSPSPDSQFMKDIIHMGLDYPKQMLKLGIQATYWNYYQKYQETIYLN